jgi:hypothetical protein
VTVMNEKGRTVSVGSGALLAEHKRGRRERVNDVFFTWKTQSSLTSLGQQPSITSHVCYRNPSWDIRFATDFLLQTFGFTLKYTSSPRCSIDSAESLHAANVKDEPRSPRDRMEFRAWLS